MCKAQFGMGEDFKWTLGYLLD